MTRFDKANQERYLDHLRHGMGRGTAAEQLGLRRPVVAGYISEHPEFAALVLEAEMDAAEIVEEALFQAAASGNVVAAKLWLDRQGVKRSPVDSPPEAVPGAGGELGAMIDEYDGG